MRLNNDVYGRAVTAEVDGNQVVYVVDDGQGNVFSLALPAGRSIESVYDTIEAMAPCPAGL